MMQLERVAFRQAAPWVALGWALYWVGLWFGHHTVALIAAAGIVPVAITGLLLGRRAGLVAALANLGATASFWAMHDGTQVLDHLQSRWSGYTVALLAGLGAGWLGESLRDARLQRDALAREITRRTEAEVLLGDSRRTWEALLSSSHDIVSLVDPEGRIRFVNRVPAGMSPRQVIGEPVASFAPPEQRGAVAAKLTHALATGAPVDIDADGPGADGTIAHYVSHVSPLVVGGKVDGALVLTRDVTHESTVHRRMAEAEERFRLASQATNDVIWDLDLRSGRLLWGDALATVFGHDVASLEPGLESWVLRVHPDDRDAVVGSFHEALEDGHMQWAGQYRFQHADGHWGHVMDRCRIVRDGTGRAQRVVGAMTDLSRLLEAEQAARQGEARWQSLVANVPAYIVTVDHDGRLRSANRRMPPLGKQDGLGHMAWEFADEAHRDEVRRAVQEAIAGGTTQVVAAQGPGPDGTLRDYEMTWAPLDDGQGAAAIGIALDVTARRQAERERDSARLEAEATEREAARMKDAAAFKTQFLNAAAHELATPLTPLKLQLATLRDRARTMPRQDAEAFALVERNVQRLGLLVNDLLDAARLQSGHLRLAPQPLDLAGLARHVADSFAEQASQARVLLTVHPGQVPTAVGDEARVTQVLFNLVHNAIKFTPADGHVRIEVGAQDGQAVLRVRDSGMGLSAAQLVRLFQPFTQVHDLPGRPGGTGLGLYIARGIVEQHGGAITASSAGPGRGSCFTVTLPAATASPLIVRSA